MSPGSITYTLITFILKGDVKVISNKVFMLFRQKKSAVEDVINYRHIRNAKCPSIIIIRNYAYILFRATTFEIFSREFFHKNLT